MGLLCHRCLVVGSALLLIIGSRQRSVGGEGRCRWRKRFEDFKFLGAKRNGEKSMVLVFDVGCS
jgi:hypothetical protein